MYSDSAGLPCLAQEGRVSSLMLPGGRLHQCQNPNTTHLFLFEQVKKIQGGECKVETPPCKVEHLKGWDPPPLELCKKGIGVHRVKMYLYAVSPA